MFIDVAVSTFITILVSTYTYQVGKHGTKGVMQRMFKDDAPSRQKHEPKHAKRVYDWERDSDFKRSLDERKNA